MLNSKNLLGCLQKCHPSQLRDFQAIPQSQRYHLKLKFCLRKKLKKSFFFLSKNSTDVKNVIYKIQPVFRWKNDDIFPTRYPSLFLKLGGSVEITCILTLFQPPSRRAPIINYEQCPTSSKPERTYKNYPEHKTAKYFHQTFQNP